MEIKIPSILFITSPFFRIDNIVNETINNVSLATDKNFTVEESIGPQFIGSMNITQESNETVNSTKDIFKPYQDCKPGQNKIEM